MSRESESMYDRLLREIEGLVFHTAKQLRHAAERAGYEFVPTEVVEEGAHAAHFILRPRRIGEVPVFARRARRRHPYHVTAVERGGVTA